MGSICCGDSLTGYCIGLSLSLWRLDVLGALVLWSLMADSLKEPPERFEACSWMSLWVIVLLSASSAQHEEVEKG